MKSKSVLYQPERILILRPFSSSFDHFPHPSTIFLILHPRLSPVYRRMNNYFIPYLGHALGQRFQFRFKIETRNGDARQRHFTRQTIITNLRSKSQKGRRQRPQQFQRGPLISSFDPTISPNGEPIEINPSST